MEVLILSKTKYGTTQVCVGGICIRNKQFVRLLNQGGYYQPANTPFNIGDIWDVSFSINSNRREPHNEDVTIHNSHFVKKIYPLATYIKSMGVSIWQNDISNIFEGKILWTNNGKGYFSENIKNYPAHSVGFWILDIELVYEQVGVQEFYTYRKNGILRQIVYKGNQAPLPRIPSGKLIRFSLAKWWAPPDGNMEARCYLQLSGWYDDMKEPVNAIENKPPTQTQAPTQNPPLLKPNVTAPEIKTTPVVKSIPAPNYSPHAQPPKNTSGNCYIATLCYDDYYADEVCSFRDFRDETLKKYHAGRVFIELYYKYAPLLTERLKFSILLNKSIKHIILNPMLAIIKLFKLDKK